MLIYETIGFIDVRTTEGAVRREDSGTGQRLTETPPTSARHCKLMRVPKTSTNIFCLLRELLITKYVMSSQNFPVKVVPSQFEETLDKAAFPQPWR